MNILKKAVNSSRTGHRISREENRGRRKTTSQKRVRFVGKGSYDDGIRVYKTFSLDIWDRDERVESK